MEKHQNDVHLRILLFFQLFLFQLHLQLFRFYLNQKLFYNFIVLVMTILQLKLKVVLRLDLQKIQKLLLELLMMYIYGKAHNQLVL